MPNVGKMNIQAGFDGKPAESGLFRLSKSLSGLTEQMKSVGSSLQFTEISSAIGLVQGLANRLGSFVQAGAKLETTQIQFGYLVGNFQKGAQVLENLRDGAAAFGVPAEAVLKTFQKLTVSGIQAATSIQFIRESLAAGELVGGGAQGVELLTNSMLSLAGSATATEQALGSVQAGGLKVYEALAQNLSQITGRTISVRDAIEELRKGTVLSATAISAISQAGNAPEALAARQRFEASFEGQLARLSATAQEFMTDISKMILTNLPLNEILSGLRGLLTGMRDIVSLVIADVGKVFDPQGRLGNIKTAFEQGKQLAVDIAETLVMGGLKFAQGIIDAAQAVTNVVRSIMNLLTSNAVTKTIAVGSQTLDRWKVETGLMSRKEFNARANERLAGLNAPRETIGALEFPSLNKTLEEMKQFFGKARARVEVPQIPNVGGLIDKNKVAEQAKLLETNVPFWKNLPDFERNFKKFGFAISANDEPVKMMIEKFLDGKIAIGELSKNIAELNIKTIAENEKMAAMNKANPLLANAAFWNTWGDWTKGLAENGFVISTNNERVRGLIDAFKGGRMAFGDFETQMMQLNSKTEVAKRGIDELSRATLKELATPLEAFNTALQGLSDQSKTLQKQIEDGLVDGQDRNKAAQALNRRAGKLIQDLLSQNQVGDSFIAGRAERGSAAAIETVLRNRFSDRGMEVQERIAAAINRQEILQKEQLKMQDKLIDAVMRVKPGTLILQGK